MNLFQHKHSPAKREKPPVAVFLAAFIVIFLLSLSALQSIGAVPYYVDGSSPASHQAAENSLPPFVVATTSAETKHYVAPERIIIPSIGMNLPISNPTSENVEVLDNALLDGPVRYPASAFLEQNGNMFIFAHSSHLAVVHNQMYKAFNRINELEQNDLITIRGGGKDYVYRVENVRLTDANEEMIDLSPSREPRLTLSSCDNFGAKTARYVVAASFVGSYNTEN